MNPSERLMVAVCDVRGRVAWLAPELERSGLMEMQDGRADLGLWTYQDGQDPASVLEELAAGFGLGPASRIGVESGKIRLFEARALSRAARCELVAADDAVMGLRLRKDPSEIDALRTAARIVDQTLERVLPKLAPGLAELEVAAEIDYQARRLGSEGAPFRTQVASGPRGALPHGAPGERKLQARDMVVLDFGAVHKGYAADITRTVAIGEPGPLAREVYAVVREAQSRAIEAAAPGVEAGSLDRAARGAIDAAGYGANFTHRTGHGLGLDVHEHPSMASGETLGLEAGMVFTVEPGVYLPGKFGVRIEDDVLITDQGRELLTSFDRELRIL